MGINMPWAPGDKLLTGRHMGHNMLASTDIPTLPVQVPDQGE